jgi:hypothetical protein
MLQYQGSVSYTLVECPKGPDTQQNGARGAWSPETDKSSIKIETTAIPTYVSGERYIIDYEALTSTLKITDFAIETHAGSGTLKAINGSAEDKTGDVIKSAMEFGISAASMGAGSPFLTGQSRNEGTTLHQAARNLAMVTAYMPVCKPETKRLLAERKSDVEAVKKLKAVMEADGRAITNIGTRASLKLASRKDRTDLLDLHSRVAKHGEDLAKLDKEIADADKKLKFTEEFRWPTDPSTLSGQLQATAARSQWANELFELAGYDAFDPAKLARLAETQSNEQLKKLLREDAAAARSDPPCTVAVASTCSEVLLGVHASFRADGEAPLSCTKGNVPCTSIAARDEQPDAGVFVRPPVSARLFLCKGRQHCAESTNPALFISASKMTPQLGQLRFIPLSNKMFQNNALSISVREDGSLEKMQYAEKSALAATALASMSSGVGKLDAYLARRVDQEEKEEKDAAAALVAARTEAAAVRSEAAAIRADEIAQYQYQIDLLQKRETLLEAQNPRDQAVAQDVLDEIARIQAQVTLATQKIALRKALAETAQ